MEAWRSGLNPLFSFLLTNLFASLSLAFLAVISLPLFKAPDILFPIEPNACKVVLMILTVPISAIAGISVNKIFSRSPMPCVFRRTVEANIAAPIIILAIGYIKIILL